MLDGLPSGQPQGPCLSLYRDRGAVGRLRIAMCRLYQKHELPARTRQAEKPSLGAWTYTATSEKKLIGFLETFRHFGKRRWWTTVQDASSRIYGGEDPSQRLHTLLQYNLADPHRPSLTCRTKNGIPLSSPLSSPSVITLSFSPPQKIARSWGNPPLAALFTRSVAFAASSSLSRKSVNREAAG